MKLPGGRNLPEATFPGDSIFLPRVRFLGACATAVTYAVGALFGTVV
jgi:hypothetical protein